MAETTYSAFENLNLSDARMKNETREEYKKRMKQNKEELELAIEELDEYLDADDRPVDDLIADTRANQNRYLKSKRYHHNARCCYWYWMQRESDANQRKAKRKKKVQK